MNWQRGSLLRVIAAVFGVVAAGCGGCQVPMGRPAWADTLGYRDEELSRIRIGQYGYAYLPVLINGEEIELFFDTGNMSALLLEPRILDRLKLLQVDEAVSYDSAGRPAGTRRVCRVDELSVFGESWKNQKATERSFRGPAGAIGPRYLMEKRCTLDYRRGFLAVSDSLLEKPPRDATVLPLVSAPRYPGMPVVPARVHEQEVLAQIDTGKSRTCIDPELIAQAGLRSGYGGVRINSIFLGPDCFTVDNAKPISLGGISEGFPSPILLGIGADILSQVVITLDYPNGRVIVMR